jgi:DmsE family decaheme c-type cytochrome
MALHPLLITLLLLGAPLVQTVGQNPPAAAPPAPQAQAKAPVPTPTPPAGKPEYAGSEACSACHEDKKPTALVFHKALETEKRLGWQGKSCEACHGPGKTHAESAEIKEILSFKTATATRVNQACLTCHARVQREGGKAFDQHARNAMSCVSCHVVHAPQAVPLLTAKAVDLCTTCHASVKAELARPYRHKIMEGMVSCVDCHSPHGTSRKATTASLAGNEPACLKCHSDKRGPFTFEHAPVKLEGCTACHEPHGSVNPRMLIRGEVRFMCMECHTLNKTALGGQPPAFHDLRTPRFQNCTTCHNKIHGSYVNRTLLR